MRKIYKVVFFEIIMSLADKSFNNKDLENIKETLAKVAYANLNLLNKLNNVDPIIEVSIAEKDGGFFNRKFPRKTQIDIFDKRNNKSLILKIILEKVGHSDNDYGIKIIFIRDYLQTKNFSNYKEVVLDKFRYAICNSCDFIDNYSDTDVMILGADHVTPEDIDPKLAEAARLRS